MFSIENVSVMLKMYLNVKVIIHIFREDDNWLLEGGGPFLRNNLY